MKIQFKSIAWFVLILTGLLASGLTFASLDESSTDVGYVAGNLHTGFSFAAKLLWAACIIVGIMLFMMSFTQFQIHRQNPKLVPLGQPITYFMLAIATLAIPFAEHIMGVDDANSAEEQARAGYYLNLDEADSELGNR